MKFSFLLPKLILFALLLVIGCQNELSINPQEKCCGIIKLKLSDSSGRPISGVEVKVRQNMKVLQTAYSDDNGIVFIDGLCLEEYELRIAKAGYGVIEKLVNVKYCKEVMYLAFEMKSNNSEADICCNSALIFKPKNSNGESVNGVKVLLYKDGKLIGDPVVKSGKAVIDGLCRGLYKVVYKLEGYQDKEFQVELGCGKELIVEEKINKLENDCCNASLKFIVKDNESKTAISGAKITLKLAGKVIFEKKVTDANGIFIARELCLGNYLVIIEKENYKPLEIQWPVKECGDFQEHFWMKK